MSANIVKAEIPKRSLIVDMASDYGMDPGAFQQTLKATVLPSNVSNEDFAAFLIVAKHYKLNPILKEIFAFPKLGGGIQPIVSVDGWANLVNSHPQADGFTFADTVSEDGQLVAITCTMYRKDRGHPVTATEYMEECKRSTGTWAQWPRRMLRHKAMIQAARYAFGFAGIMDPDEGERVKAEHYDGIPGARLTPPPAPVDGPTEDAAEDVDQVSPGAAYAELVRDSYDELNGCETEEQVEEIRDRVLADLKVGDRDAWKSRCAERSAEIFGAK